MAQAVYLATRTADDGTLKRSSQTVAFGTAGVSVSSGQGRLYKIKASNTHPISKYFIQIFDKSTSPTAGDTPVWSAQVASRSDIDLDFSGGLYLRNGIGIALSSTGGILTPTAGDSAIAELSYTNTPVSTAGAAPTLSGAFSYSVVDTVGGYAVTATGTNLSGATATLNASGVTVTGTTSGSVTFTMPAISAGSYTFQVTTTGGTASALLYVESSPIFWIEADQAVTSSGNVTSVPNTAKSSVDLSVSQATGANQPTYNATHSSFNNNPAIVHNGTTQYLTSAVLGSVIAQPSWVVGVAKWDALASAFHFLCDDVSGGPRQAVFVNAGNQFGYYADGGIVSGGTPVAGTVYCVCAVFDSSGGTSAFYVNDPTTAIFTGSPGSSGRKSLTIGAQFNGSGNFLNGAWGTIAEFGGSPDLTTRTREMGRLKTKYGIP